MGDCNYDIHIHLYKVVLLYHWSDSNNRDQPLFLQGICIRGSANDACIRWNTLEDLSDDAADSIEDVYRPAFALCITAFALSCALSLICVVQSVLPVTKSYVLQAILFIGSTMTVAFLAVALYETSSTYLTHPSNYDDCPNASSGGAPGYTACAIGVGTSAAVTILSMWPVFAGFQAAGYDIQVQPVVLPQVIV